MDMSRDLSLLERGGVLPNPPRRALRCPACFPTDTADLEGALDRAQGCVTWEADRMQPQHEHPGHGQGGLEASTSPPVQWGSNPQSHVRVQ